MPEIDELVFRLTNFQRFIDSNLEFDEALQCAKDILGDRSNLSNAIDHVINEMERCRETGILTDWIEREGDAIVKLLHAQSKGIAVQPQKALSKALDMVSIRLIEEKPLLSNKAIVCPDDAVELIGKYIKQMDREVLALVNVDSGKHPINASIVSIGVTNTTFLSTQSIMKAALLSNASAIFLLHNHPSGNLTPSDDDIQSTARIRQAAELLEISVLDHIIVGARNDQYYSFFEHGLFNDFEQSAMHKPVKGRRMG